ncbi:uncharacterized protein C5L36_0C08770 [Pichia kudriavzevii]|uniref:Nucleus export protein BRL1 n=1 Tax=Pichia kudriavzevii TaxID=4909 RepID=A0A1V2LQR9_PICKU|nr:uncharacterized protein C5L36_0C08770 [Pichia kudriavzevii]AWU76965.1 hypothetical protein C5L36_0C08770 [Pichia kudriavzevii]ONH70472.1 Nucleus export protein BRL1 [Pichia kudriavzevii]ONH76208.1 Nucleus export protein BRL1 [Pichia kudriavzevii]
MNRIVDELEEKLRLQDRYYEPMDIDDDVDDDDIEMRDYDDSFDKSLLRRRVVNPVEDTVGDGEEEMHLEDEIDSESAMTSGRRMAGALALLQPENHGYLVGKSVSGRANREEDVGTPSKERSLQTLTQGLGDGRKIVIHNHFYNSNQHEEPWPTGDNININSMRFGKVELFELLKRSINYSLLVWIAYLVLIQIRQDIMEEYRKMEIRNSFMREQCLQEYIVNRCEEYGQLPALKEECLQWEVCYHGGVNDIHREPPVLEIAVHVLGRTIESGLSRLGGLNKLLVLVCVCAWYMGNFALGYMKATRDAHNA